MVISKLLRQSILMVKDDGNDDGDDNVDCGSGGRNSG